jgi:hypothetical protein
MSRAARTLLRRPIFLTLAAGRCERPMSPMTSRAMCEQSWRNFVKKSFRVGILTAIVLTVFASATFVARTASASPAPAFPGLGKNKNKNKNTNEHTKEMRKHQKKLILKGRHGRHKEKHT